MGRRPSGGDRLCRPCPLIMHPSTELSIIFVNWNSFYLRESVESIYANTTGIEFEVIV